MREVEVRPRSLDGLSEALTDEQRLRFRFAAETAARALEGRTVWNVSSTANGGGVAEMLHTLLGYVAGAGVRTRWLLVTGDADFFAITKRLHNAVHGVAERPFDVADREHYRAVLAQDEPGLLDRVGPRDLVLLHDPQTAGLVGGLRRRGVAVVWRSHIGLDARTAASDLAWDFLRPSLEGADAFVFSRRQYAPAWVPAERLWVVPPSIDPVSDKNRDLTAEECLDVLTRAGLMSGADAPATVSSSVQGGPPPGPDARLVVQVSRWDRLKDMAGVMEGFARMGPGPDDVHLMLVGPDVDGVTDDPEGAQVLADCVQRWRSLAAGVRERVHLVSVPTEDPQENALVVNAVQRHATVVAQKSLAEGFGLTVAEAMWKSRPVVASAVGGIQDQVEDGRSGLLLPDPRNLDAFARAVRGLLDDPPRAAWLGAAARLRVRDRFLGDRHLSQHAALFESLVTQQRAAG